MGSQRRPPPPPVVNQAVPRTTPSRRRVTRYGLVHNGWGVRRHCGRLAGGCYFPKEKMQERKTHSRQKKGKSHPPEKPKKTPENKTEETPELRTEKQPLGRRKNTDQKQTGFRNKKREIAGKTPVGRAWVKNSTMMCGWDRMIVSIDH